MEAPANKLQVTLYTIEQAAAIIGIGRTTLYRALARQQVPHTLLPGTSIVRLTPEDIEQYIADGQRPAAAA